MKIKGFNADLIRKKKYKKYIEKDNSVTISYLSNKIIEVKGVKISSKLINKYSVS